VGVMLHNLVVSIKNLLSLKETLKVSMLLT
jgi:hypothetical protein